MKTYTLPVICCYCGTKTGEKPGFTFYDPLGTSTICPACKEKEEGATLLENGKLVFVKDGKAWQRLTGQQWEEIDKEDRCE
jgi:hypothetical protein